MITLQDLVQDGLKDTGETPSDIVAILIQTDHTRHWALFHDLAQYKGSEGFGTVELPNVWVWTQKYVYLKICPSGEEKTCLEDPEQPVGMFFDGDGPSFHYGQYCDGKRQSCITTVKERENVTTQCKAYDES